MAPRTGLLDQSEHVSERRLDRPATRDPLGPGQEACVSELGAALDPSGSSAGAPGPDRLLRFRECQLALSILACRVCTAEGVECRRQRRADREPALAI
jgi:hypothetical protein